MDREMYSYDPPLNRVQYKAARYYAMRYKEWFRELNYGNPDPERRQALDDHLELIKSTAKEADPELYPWLMEYITSSNATYGILRAKTGVPCSAYTFNKSKRYFYYLLAKRM